MAVGRIKFPDKRCARATADAMEKSYKYHGRGVREIRRAIERPGHSVELTSEEMEALAKISGDLPPRARPLVEAALEAVRKAERDELEYRQRARAFADARR